MTAADVKLQILNAALVETGNNEIAALGDNSAEDLVFQDRYESLVSAELVKGAYHWATKTAAPASGSTPTDTRYDYSYDLPADLLDLKDVMVNGSPWVSYLEEGQSLLINASTGVLLKYVWRVTEDLWPQSFIEAMILRMAARAYAGLNQDEVEAKRTDDLAADEFLKCGKVKSKPRRLFFSPLIHRRRYGVSKNFPQ